MAAFLEQRQVDRQELQRQVDQWVAGIRQEIEEAAASVPPELREIFESLQQAAGSGQDLDPLLQALRDQLLQLHPDQAAVVDQWIEGIRQELGGADPDP